jgi:hypothetical protein
MEYTLINHHNPSEMSARIAEIKELDLSKTSLNEVKKILSTSMPMPYNTFLQNPGGYVYRGQTNDDEVPFDRISRISFNPSPSTKAQRASLPGDIVFYASNGIGIVAHEAIQDEYRKTGRKVYHATVGKWRIKNPLSVMIVCHSRKALEAGTDIVKALVALERGMRNNHYNDAQIEAWQMRSEFLSDEFAKEKITCEQDYYFSAAWASYLFSKLDNCDGIIYPSVTYAYKGHNFAYRANLIKDGKIVLSEVSFLKIEVNSSGMIKYEIVATTNSFDEDKIIWI